MGDGERKKERGGEMERKRNRAVVEEREREGGCGGDVQRYING